MTTKIIAESDHIRVMQDVSSSATGDNNYYVFSDGVLRHPKCTAEDVMRALTHYLRGLEYKLEKSKKSQGE